MSSKPAWAPCNTESREGEGRKERGREVRKERRKERKIIDLIFLSFFFFYISVKCKNQTKTKAWGAHVSTQRRKMNILKRVVKG